MNFTPNLTTREQENATLSRYESIEKYMVRLKDLITFRPDQEINEVIDIIITKKISGAPVLDDMGKLVGIISEKDCLRIIVEQAYHNLPFNPKVSDYMTRDVKTMSLRSDIVEAASAFLNTPIRRLPVVDDNGALIGQISRRDVLRGAKNISPTQWP